MSVPDPIKNKQKQPFSGTCEELATYIQDEGVTDSTGKNHPTYVGWTYSYFSYSNGDYTPKKTLKTILFCNCNDRYYDDIKKCIKECKTSLGCFDGICDPVTDKVCLEAKVSVTFSVRNTVTVLDWQPSTPISKTCQASKNAWDKAIEKHELVHVNAAQTILGKRSKPTLRTFYGCGDTEEEAKANLAAQMEKQLNAEVDAMKARAADMADKFHHQPKGKPIPLDCESCD